MKILFIGSFVPPQDAGLYSGISIAGNQMQRGFLLGFVQNGVHAQAISVTPRTMKRLWRCDKEAWVQKKSEKNYENIKICNVGYFNVPVLKQISIAVGLWKAISKTLKQNIDEQYIVCVYNTVSYFCGPAIAVAKKYNTKCIGIIADLPIQNKNVGFIRNLENKYEINAIKKFDQLITLTQYTAMDFGLGIPYLVIEAGIDTQPTVTKSEKSKDSRHSILYTGSLNALSGMQLVLELAYICQDMDVEIEIYGSGEFASAVREAEKRGLPIHYHGSVSHAVALAAQESADILICPRMPDNFTTKYTFPSKVLEYISRGKPVICNRLAGIPEEYDTLVNYPDTCSAQDWKKMIAKIFEEYDFYLQKAKNAKLYIQKNKNWKKCTQRVIEFIKQ